MVGLPFQDGRQVRGDGTRMAWAFYGDGTGELMVSLFDVRPGWHLNVHDDTGGAVQTETSLHGVPATWVTRPDGAHYVIFRVGGVDVGLAGNLGGARIRTVAESVVGVGQGKGV